MSAGLVFMKKLIYYSTLLLIPTLTGLSVYGAFLGTERAHNLFNSVPLIVYWFTTVIVIIAGVFSFKKRCRPSLFLIHVGIVLIFLGSMLSSEKGHAVSRRLFKREKPVQSQMIIYEGQSSNELYDPSKMQVFQLPFEIRLNDFILERYPDDGSAKDYISKVDVIKNGDVIQSANIEVNYPLHIGGFHFYQSGYDVEQHQYTILKVVSDAGLNVVLGGYAVLCIGIFWYFWFVRLRHG